MGITRPPQTPIFVHKKKADRKPAAMVRGVGALSTRDEDARKAKNEIINKFIRQGFPDTIIDRLRNTETRPNTLRTKRAKPPGVQLYFAVGFDPCWRRAIPVAIRRFESNAAFRALISDLFKKQDVRVRVAWRNRLPAAVNILTKV